MKNSKKQSNKSKYDDDEDDISIRSLFSPDPLEEISSEQPTFSNYGKIEQSNFPTSNYHLQSAQRKNLGFGINQLTPLTNVINNRMKSFDNFSSNKGFFQPSDSIFGLPTVNPNRKIIRLENLKPIQIITPLTKTLVVKPNPNRPDPLFTKIVYNKPKNNVLISIPVNHIDSNRSSVSFTQSHDNRISASLFNSPNLQDHKTKVIHHYHFYENPFKFLKKNGIFQNQSERIKRKNIPIFNSSTQIQYMEKNAKLIERNNYETKHMISKTPVDSPNFESDNFMYRKRNNQ